MKTPTKKRKQKRDQKIYAELLKLKALPGSMPTACELAVAKKYGVSRSTIYNIAKRIGGISKLASV
ncbi:hypothetical protein GCM10028806_28160 [Spirosoma terrae]|uniref:Helix-turn-helix domain-containing protein n=1 Tax=Spirosoma terrae TaxID=1968276 RepID=A0A6L9LDL2_9BACT|nr:hypothetical protein [Spirosoma terrae]NDU97221.1 hypothetical protein [Spirosoma terrae]